jgi:mono/diheme cytochrome c family protein
LNSRATLTVEQDIMKTTRLILASALLPLAFARAADELTYIKDIKPIFEKHCSECHGEKKAKGALRLDTKEHVYGGDDDDEYAVVPGKSDKSLAYTLAVTKDEDDLMPPPDENNPLSPEQIATLKKWIDSGAAWDTGDKPANQPNVRKKEKKK